MRWKLIRGARELLTGWCLSTGQGKKFLGTVDFRLTCQVSWALGCGRLRHPASGSDQNAALILISLEFAAPSRGIDSILLFSALAGSGFAMLHKLGISATASGSTVEDNPDPLFLSVGRVMSGWEMIEFELSRTI